MFNKFDFMYVFRGGGSLYIKNSLSDRYEMKLIGEPILVYT